MKLNDLIKKPDTLEEAEQRIKDLQAEKAKLQDKISSLDDEIEALQDETGETSLQDALEGTSNSGNKFRTLRNKQNERDAKLKGLEKIEGYIQKAEKDKILAKAQQKRTEAKKLNKEASQIEDETNNHLKALQEIQGCEYVPFVRTQNKSVPLAAVSTEISKKYVTPKSERLRRQAEGLIKEAEQLEKQTKSAKQEQSNKNLSKAV